MHRRALIKGMLVAPAPLALGAAGVAAQAVPDTGAVADARLTAPLPVPPGGTINVAFLLAAEARVIDFAGPWGVFEYVYVGENYHKPFKLYTVAATTDPVIVTSGMRVVPNHTFADAPPPNVVVVPAVNTDTLAPAALDWLRAVHAKTDLTASVCNGAYVLGMAGLLDGRRATAHHGGYGLLRTYSPKATVVRGARFIEDGRIATSGGLTSGMDLALRIIERYYGRDVARRAAESLEYQGTGWMHPGSNAQWTKKRTGTYDRPICQVCEAQIPRATAVTWAYEGTTYFFCGDWCRQQFMAMPVRFLGDS
jgi:transcriptional regulator GlxA family with amidase domain